MTRYPKECRKQWRPKQEKLGWEKQKKEEVKEKAGRKGRKTTEKGKNSRCEKSSGRIGDFG